MPWNRRDLALPAALGVVGALLHLLTATDSWGLFRDELYYVACSKHLAFGYVDHPPLVAVMTRLGRALLGESQLALRCFPALAAGGTVFFAALMARDLGGGRWAQALAAAATALAPIYVSLFGILSMNGYDVLLWAAAGWVLVRLLGSGEPRWWLAFGAVAGLGLENKLSIAFLGAGLVAGLLLAGRWRELARPRLWLGGLLAAALFLPNLIWQALHGWPTLEFMENATRIKNLPLSPLSFLSEQVSMMNPLALPLALAGLAFLLLARDGRPYRAIGWAFLAVTLLMITQRSKAYYLSPAYTLLFAPGAVMAGRLAGRWAWLRPAYLAVLVLGGLALFPLGKPVLPLESHVAYMELLGEAPSTGERKEVGRLSQFFADRLGWPELAETVAEVYRSLPPEEREKACVYGQNYGHAGAIDHYGPPLGLPPAIAGHNSYHLWGPGACTGEVVIVIDGDREDLAEIFEQVDEAAVYTCADCMPYEAEKPILIARRPRLPMAELWPRTKHFD